MKDVKPNRPHDDYVYKDSLTTLNLNQIAYIEYVPQPSQVIHIWYTDDELAKREAQKNETTVYELNKYSSALQEVHELVESIDWDDIKLTIKMIKEVVEAV